MALDLEDLPRLDGSEWRNISAEERSRRESRRYRVVICTYCQRLCIPCERCMSTRAPKSRRKSNSLPSADSQG